MRRSVSSISVVADAMAQLAAALAPGERERETERAATLLGSSP
jgi:hypothetical protein